MQQATTSISIPDLSSAVRGRVIGPEDPDYDAARTVLVPIAAERRPAAVVRVADAADVVAVVNYARDHGSSSRSAAAGTAPPAIAPLTAAS